MKRMLAGLLFILVLCLCLTAEAEPIKPLTIDPYSLSLDSGTYFTKVLDADRIMNGGYFTLALYCEDFYSADEIESIGLDDEILVNGKSFTVLETEMHDEAIELLFKEDTYEYIVMCKVPDTSVYFALVDDWVPVTYIKSQKVMMPLFNKFVYREISGDGEYTDYDQDAFASMLADSGTDELFSPYNTTVTFENGGPIMIEVSDYPFGPDE